jgi:hypothetical protein
MLAEDVWPAWSGLNAPLFLKDVLDRCPGRPEPAGDRGPRYDWPLELLNYESEREVYRNRALIEACFGLFKYRTRCFRYPRPYRSSTNNAPIKS